MDRALRISQGSFAGFSLLSLAVFGYDLHTLVLSGLTLALTGATILHHERAARRP